MTQQTNEVENTQDDTLFITELEEFVPLLTDWHQRQVATVLHFQNVPPGMEVQVEGEEETLILEGKTLEGFRMGISLALSYLGMLPFVTGYEEPPEMH